MSEMAPLPVVESAEKRYLLAKQGAYRTRQGEGLLLGEATIFVRLAGCSVGCSGCDTDYAASERLSLSDLVSRISSLVRWPGEWVWLTGGEPTDQGLGPLVAGIRRSGARVALATAGTRKVKLGSATGGVDFLSVSPHSPDFVQRAGNQLNLVPGLNGLSLADFSRETCDGLLRSFSACYVTPMDGTAWEASLKECLSWLEVRPGWRLGVQAHKTWQLP